MTKRPTDPERRAHPRAPAGLACKVRPEAGIRYAPGFAVDLSAGGAMLEVRSPRSIRPGDTVEVILDDARRALLRDDDRLLARVVRVVPGALGDRVAVRFEAPAAGLAAA